MAPDRCGYTYQTHGHADLGSGCCWRPVWNDRDRCIWHADEEYKPVDELEAAITETDHRLDGAMLTNATLDGVEWLAGMVLLNADLEHVTADESDFSDADLRNANLRGASIRGADLRRVNLEAAVLSDTDLNDTDLRDARFHEANLTRSYIGHETVLGRHVVYENEFERAEDDHEKRKSFDAATWSYRTLQYWCRENGLIDRTEEFFVREKDLRRRFAWYRNEYFHALRSEGSRYLMGYGYRIRGILLASLAVILLSTALFPLLGGIHETVPQRSITYALESPLEHPVDDLLTVYAKSFYLSLESFTTLGIGDVTPGGYPGQVLAGVQALVGYVLLALLISVLARRRYWL